MKKVLLFLALIVPMALASFTVDAQNYYVYDGNQFSVMLTANNSNSYITSVEFSDGGQWVHFDIFETENLEGRYEGGFKYYVRDGRGVAYTIDYWRSSDEIIVNSLDNGSQWILRRR